MPLAVHMHMMAVDIVDYFGEVPPAGNSILAARGISKTYHGRIILLNLIDLMYDDHYVDHRLGFDPWNRGAADVMDRDQLAGKYLGKLSGFMVIFFRPVRIIWFHFNCARHIRYP